MYSYLSHVEERPPVQTKMLKVLGIIWLAHQTLCLNTSSALYNQVLTHHKETDFKAEFAYEVVDKIYNAFRQWFFTIIFCEFTYFENRILKYTETKDSGYPVLLLDGCPSPNKTKVKPRLNKHGQTAYIVTSDKLNLEVNEFALGALLRTGVFKPRSPVIFVINVPVQVNSYFYYAMEEHFQLLWSRKITNSVLLVLSDKLRMYTYNPFFNQIIEITEIKDVSRLLSKQYNDLYGHILRLSVFRKIYISDETGPIRCESKLTETVIKYLNATCLPLAPRDGNTVGDLLDNGTATGVTGDLIDGYTDLELSSRILKDSYYGYIDTTYPLVQDELCFLVKKSEKQSTFATTIKMISTNLLTLFIFNVIFLITAAILTRNLEINIMNVNVKQTASSTAMDLIKCFLRQTVDITFLGPAFRMVVLLIITYSLVIDCVIDGIITSAITYPRYKRDVDTLQELIQTNLILGVHNRHMKIFNGSFNDVTYKLIRNRVEAFNDKKIKQVIEERQYQYAVLLRKSDANYISQKPANMKDGRPLFHTIQECPIPCSIVYGLEYGSPYLPRLNYILHHLNQGGILQHWSKSEEYTLHKNLGKILLADDNKERKSLDMENLKEVFYVWLVGLLISFIILLFEILLHTFNHL